MSNMPPVLRRRRSSITGSLFLMRGRNRPPLGMVFSWPDGAFGWKPHGALSDSTHYQTEQQAIDALYAALGM